MTDKERFSEICRHVRDAEHIRDSIGTYSEKSVHLALKMFFEPDEQYREVPVGKFIADISNQTGIHEIQTSGFSPLKKKLEAYLSDYDVELIYPVAEKKKVYWLSPETGEVEKEYNSPRHVKPAEIFTELLYLGECLYSPRLSFTIVSLAVDEVCLLDGYGVNKKRRATKVDRIPTELLGIQHFPDARSMAELLPYSNGEKITAAMIRKYLSAPGRSGWAALKILEELDICRRIGKEGRKIIYEFNKP